MPNPNADSRAVSPASSTSSALVPTESRKLAGTSTIASRASWPGPVPVAAAGVAVFACRVTVTSDGTTISVPVPVTGPLKVSVPPATWMPVQDPAGALPSSSWLANHTLPAGTS